MVRKLETDKQSEFRPNLLIPKYYIKVALKRSKEKEEETDEEIPIPNVPFLKSRQ